MTSTIDNPPFISSERQTGNSTRLVDHAIQLLFENRTILVRDHCNIKEAHDNLYDRVLRRLQFEHSWVKIKKHDKKRHIIEI